jgi:TP901 family phage tail tape measure protein
VSNVENIGIRVSLVNGKATAAELVSLQKTVKGVGDAVAETDAKAGIAGASASGLSRMEKKANAVKFSLAGVSTSAKSLGNVMETAGVAGAGAVSTFGERTAESEVHAKSFLGTVGQVGKYLGIGFVAAAVAGGYELVKLGGELNEAEAAVQANAGITAAAAKQVGDAMMRTSGTTSYTATELTNAYAGVAQQLAHVQGSVLSAAQSLGFMQQAWHLAEASGQDLNQTTKDLAATMQGYHLTQQQAGGAADVLFNESRLTGASVDSLTQVTGRLHARLQATIPSLEDMSGFMLDLADHGARGSRGVMVAGQALDTLTGNSKGTLAMLNAMGVHLYDVQGNFVGMGSVIEQLQGPLSRLSPQMQNLALQALFGQNAWQMMGKVVEAGTETFNKNVEAVSETGTANEAAEAKLHSFKGQVEILKASSENLGATLGQNLLPKILAIANALVHAATWVAKNKDVAIALAAVLGGVVIFAIAAYIGGIIAAMSATVAFWAVATLGIAVAVVAIVAGILWLVHNWSRAWTDIKNWVGDAWNWIRSHALLIAGIIGLESPILAGILLLAVHWRGIWQGIKTVVHDVWQFLKPIFDAIGAGVHGIADVVSVISHGGGIGSVFKGFGHMLGFAEGGVVPGPQGAPMVAVVHGGEIVIPPPPVGGTGTQGWLSGMAASIPAAPSVSLSSATTTTSSISETTIDPGTVAVSAGPVGSDGQPVQIQLVVDGRVLAETMWNYTDRKAARSG